MKKRMNQSKHLELRINASNDGLLGYNNLTLIILIKESTMVGLILIV